MFALVCQHQRIAPGRPVRLVALCSFDPFGQFGRARQGLFDQTRHPRLGQPFGKAVDRLAQPLERLAALLDHMIGMDDLEHVAEPFQLARNPASFAFGQLLLRGIGRAPEIGERHHVARRILRQHAVGRTRVAAAAMFADRQFHDDLLALAAIVDIVDRTPRHEPFGQVVGDIAHPRQAELVERLLQLGAHPFERLGLGKQRIEDIRAHGRT